jgi:hypothetical protein
MFGSLFENILKLENSKENSRIHPLGGLEEIMSCLDRFASLSRWRNFRERHFLSANQRILQKTCRRSEAAQFVVQDHK